MNRSLFAHFDGRVFIPEEPLELSPGQRVRIEIEPIEAEQPRFAELLELSADLPDAPCDLSAQHDHYLYGTPKK